MVRLAQIQILTAGAGHARGQLRPDERSRHGQRSARDPHPQDQQRRVHLQRHHVRIDEDARSHDAAITIMVASNILS
jgi:hypothetical protein